MRRHFGDMLLKRRRQMGVSIQQASNIVKIRPQIIEYFETENFAAMPPRGYAQGMIASYARYLGLNPHEVVEAYFDSLDEYERAGGRAGRFEEVATGASPRSAHATGRYLMVGSVPPSRFAHRPAQAGYVSESSSPHEPVSTARLRPGGPQGARRPDGRRAPMRGEGQGRLPDGRVRRASRGYREDARVRQGREPAYGAARDARRPSSRGGRSARGSQLPPLDMRLVLLGAVALLIVAILVMLLLRGCAPASGEAAGSSATVSAVPKDAASSTGTTDGGAEGEGGEGAADTQGGDGESDASAAADDEEKVPEETVVKVSLKEKGAVAWVEVKLDGKIVLGKQVVGPFEEQFTVGTQIDITTDSPSTVSVYQNGEKVRYDTKVSGVGKVTIVAPEVEDDGEKTVDSDGDGTPDMTSEEAREAGVPVPGDPSDTAA